MYSACPIEQCFFLSGQLPSSHFISAPMLEFAAMICIRLALYFFLFPISGFAQSLLLGNPCGTLDSAWLDPINFTENPASATTVSSTQFGFFGGQYKDVKGLNFFSVAFAMPFKKVAVALVINHMGTSGYQQNNVNLLLAKNLGLISIGIMFRSEMISIQSEGGYVTMKLGIGVSKNSGQLTFGASVQGIGLTMNATKERGIQKLKLSSQCLFKVSELVSVCLLGSKQAGQSISIQPAINYRPGVISFSLGFDSYGNNIFLLTGWQYKGYEIKMMLGYQATLGLSNGVEVLYKKRR